MGKAFELIDITQGPLHGVSLHADHGETVVLAGARGTGKHLILKMILGLVRPASGTVRVLGKDLAQLTVQERRKLRIPVSLVPIEGPLLSNLSVYDNVALPLRYHLDLSVQDVDTRVRSALANMRLEHLASARPVQLSIPQCRLASLARARLMRPEILLLEDPFMGMDDGDADLVSTAVEEVVRAGCAVLVTLLGRRVETVHGGRLLDLPNVRVVHRGEA